MTAGNDRPDRLATEQALLKLVFQRRAERSALGSDALWASRDLAGNGPVRAAETARA